MKRDQIALRRVRKWNRVQRQAGREARHTYAVKILHQWLLEPVTHEIWETAALSTIYSTAREKEKDRESSHTVYTPGQSGHRFFTRAEELRPILQSATSSRRRQRARINWDAQVPSIARRTLWPSDSSDKPPVLNSCWEEALTVALWRQKPICSSALFCSSR